MNKTISIINKLNAKRVLLFGVGVPSIFFDKINGDKLGIDQFDKTYFPRLWTGHVYQNNIQQEPTKEKFNLVIINDKKRYSDLDKYFKQALTNINKGGKIVITHTMPKSFDLVRPDPAKHQFWCGDSHLFILDLISKGGYKVTSYDCDYGLSIIEVDKRKKPKKIKVGPWEDWFITRLKTMSN